ncbi:MAG: TfoX/Sxy family protein [Cyanobacteria bacterium]|nr:TfoX/Sxy family protein [Cyanobacteriota bacterium]
MGTQQSTIDYLMEQLEVASKAGAPSCLIYVKKMFGEYGLFREGKMVALVCDDQLFIKPTAVGRTLLGKVQEAPPYPGAKPCFLIPRERWEDFDWLLEVFKRSADELPFPKVKKPKAKKSSK